MSHKTSIRQNKKQQLVRTRNKQLHITLATVCFWSNQNRKKQNFSLTLASKIEATKANHSLELND
jgi:hypothetical protein